MIASEVAPWAKTGGLADVLGALPSALMTLGHRVTVVLPQYRGVQPAEADSRAVRLTLGHTPHDVVLRVQTTSPGLRHVFVDYPPFFDRERIYGGADGKDYTDNAQRFGLLSAAALEFAEADPERGPLDIVHAHDWQTGIALAMLRTQSARWPRVARAGTVCTIHNLAYQGLFPKAVIGELGLGWEVFSLEGAEFWGQVSLLKAGISYADWVTTVSPSYARETQTAAFGCGFEGVLAARRDHYVGILNGIDTNAWNPATDPLLPAHYDAGDLSGKGICKRALLEAFGLPVGDDAMARPIVGIVSRLVDQKGFDLIAEAADPLLAMDATWVVVGTGDRRYEDLWRRLRQRAPSRVGVFIGFSEPLAHLVEAGADIFLMPSRFEPCGLNQMYSLRYGTVPVVHGVGGLDDTIQPYTPLARQANGFKFKEASADVLVRALRQALRLYRNRSAWEALMRQGMGARHSWDHAAREYVKVYKRARRDAAARRAN